MTLLPVLLEAVNARKNRALRLAEAVECELASDLPVMPEELKLIQDLLPELLKEMAWQQADKE